MEDQTTIFPKDHPPTQIFGASGRFWIALVCAVALCVILIVGTIKEKQLDAGSVSILASLVATYMAQKMTGK